MKPSRNATHRQNLTCAKSLAIMIQQLIVKCLLLHVCLRCYTRIFVYRELCTL